MHFSRLASTVVLALAATACSDDKDDPAPDDTRVNANQPSGSTGGTASSGAAGGAGTAPGAGNGGSTSETPANPALNQGGGTANDPGGAAAGAGGTDAVTPPPAAGDAGAVAPPADDDGMSFFATSRGVATGGNFGGLVGADALCDELATAVSAELGAKTWRAYLSTTTVNARDRIGTGPWFNQAGVLVANNLTQLHDQGMGGTLDQTWAPGNAAIALDEQGNQVPSGNPQQHDILTGTLADGTVAAGLTCSDWTATTGTVQVGHANRAGGGAAPSSWSAAHGNVGCAPIGAPAPNVTSGGGRGSIYCFATD